MPGKRPGGGQKGLCSDGKRGQAGRAAAVPLTRALSLGLQQPPGPQDGLPSPLGLQGGLEQGNELSKGTTGQ